MGLPRDLVQVIYEFLPECFIHTLAECVHHAMTAPFDHIVWDGLNAKNINLMWYDHYQLQFFLEMSHEHIRPKGDYRIATGVWSWEVYSGSGQNKTLDFYTMAQHDVETQCFLVAEIMYDMWTRDMLWFEETPPIHEKFVSIGKLLPKRFTADHLLKLMNSNPYIA